MPRGPWGPSLAAWEASGGVRRGPGRPPKATVCVADSTRTRVNTDNVSHQRQRRATGVTTPQGAMRAMHPHSFVYAYCIFTLVCSTSPHRNSTARHPRRAPRSRLVFFLPHPPSLTSSVCLAYPYQVLGFAVLRLLLHPRLGFGFHLPASSRFVSCYIRTQDTTLRL